MIDIFHSAMCSNHRLTTLKDMTPVQAEVAQRDAETWAKDGLARRDRCNRCGQYYDVPNPDCLNAKVHDKGTDHANL